jgi:putative flippase GtrA
VSQILKFLVAGIVAALLNWGSRFIFSIWFPFEVAVTIAFFFGLSSAFLLMKRYVFQAKKNSLKTQMFSFLAINLLALIVTVAVSSLSLRVFLPKTSIDASYHEAVAHFLGIVAPVFTSFLGHKYLTFK